MSAWEVTDEDIRQVLDRHNVKMTQEEYDAFCESIDFDEITGNVLRFVNFDNQVESMLDDIEDALVEKGFIKKENKVWGNYEEDDS